VKAIRTRRSIRRFGDRQVERELLIALLEAATWAPSGSNSQSWLFTAIQNEDVLKRLNQLVKEGFQRWTPDDDYPPKQSIKERTKNENFNFYYKAPTLIIASNRSNYENAMADCSLALENIFLAAQPLGLGSCYINNLHWLRNDTPLRDYLLTLGIPKEHTICSSAAIGYIEKMPEPPARKSNTIHILSPGEVNIEVI
jgi:nitroreductase